MDEDLRSRYRRDFTKEIIRQPQPTSRPAGSTFTPGNRGLPESQSRPPVKKPRRRRSPKLMLAVILLGLIAGAGGGGYWYWSQRLKSPIPPATQASVNFPLLYPSRLPAGFSLDSSSFDTSGNVVVFTADNNSGLNIAFTDQKRPATFDFNSFYKGLSDSSSFDTDIGHAAIGTVNGHPLGSLVTDQSWLLVSSSSKSIQSDDLKLILENLKISSR